ncbi:hypothetical protein FRB90_002070 [Tulasnella sp. 427]|nr:hypothetical protein FRB90_002070 [Tulasnella sp. 427]
MTRKRLLNLRKMIPSGISLTQFSTQYPGQRGSSLMRNGLQKRRRWYVFTHTACRRSLISLQLDKGASTARSDDVSSLKKAIVDFLPACDPPISRNSKTRRGFNHPYIGSLLCPTSLDWNDDEIRRELRDEVITVKHTLWPPFLYRDYAIDPDDLLDGLFESSVLLKAARHIFISPSSADEEGSRSTRAGNAALNGMTRVTPASIAYVATQVRFALSSDMVFGRKIKPAQFDLYAFYDNIIIGPSVETLDETGDDDGGTAAAILAQLR